MTCKKSAVSAYAPHRELKKGEKLNFAMIGNGIQGRDVLKDFIANGKFNIVAVCDVDKERVAYAKSLVDDAYGNKKCKAVGDFRLILKNPKIDVVGIATPDHWHAYIAVEAMKHGKDVFCEKPLTFTVDEARKVMEAEKKYGRVFQVNSWQRSWNIFRTAAMIVRNGFLGNVRYVDANYGIGGEKLGGPSHPIRFFDVAENAATEGAPNPSVDWDMWLGPAKVRPYSDQLAPRGVNTFYPMFWRFDDDFGTGYNGDWGAHHLDIAQWGMNMDASGPYKIIRSEEPYSTNPLHGGRRQFGMRMLFKAEYGDIELFHRPFGVWGTVFYCDNGIVAVNRGKLAVWEGTGLVKPDEKVRKAVAEGTFKKSKIVVKAIGEDYGTDINIKKDDVLSKAVSLLEKKYKLAKAKVQLFQPLDGHVGDFINSCYDRTPTICPAKVSGRSAILCGLCNLSYVYDTGFDWNPKTNDFANGTGKGISLKREYYRNGWNVEV